MILAQYRITPKLSAPVLAVAVFANWPLSYGLVAWIDYAGFPLKIAMRDQGVLRRFERGALAIDIATPLAAIIRLFASRRFRRR